MHWHPQPLRCSRALVLRGYARGSYAAQSPYQALMVVITRSGKHQVQGLLSTQALSGLDIARLKRACASRGVRVVTTRRHGRRTLIKSDS